LGKARFRKYPTHESRTPGITLPQLGSSEVFFHPLAIVFACRFSDADFGGVDLFDLGSDEVFFYRLSR
jgi:hypothetical protein